MTTLNRSRRHLDCVSKILSSSTEPLTIDGLVAQVRQQIPIDTPARSTILGMVDTLYQAVPVGATRIGWLSRLLTHNSLRHTLEADELRRGYIMLDELEHAVFFPQFFQDHEPDGRVLTLELFDGDALQAVAAAQQEIWALHAGTPLAEWLDARGALPDDDLIIQVLDAAEGRYLLRLQPREIRDEEGIEARNQALAQAAEEIAEELLHRRALFTWELVAHLVARGLFRDSLPPDDLHYVLEEYSRLHLVEGEGYELVLGERSQSTGPFAPPASGRGSKPTGKPIDTSAGSRLATPRPAPRPAPPKPLAGRRFPFNTNPFLGDSMDSSKRSPFDNQPEEDTCDAYEEYLESFGAAHRMGEPLSHDDFHLLEAELESLVDLEMEFGYLMADQTTRKQELADRLFIDPETLVDGWDEGDDLDGDGSALWN